jgi:hypothetical protein
MLCFDVLNPVSGYFQDFKEILKISKTREINTLVLISREIRISGFSLENPEGDVKDVIIFLKKMI